MGRDGVPQRRVGRRVLVQVGAPADGGQLAAAQQPPQLDVGVARGEQPRTAVQRRQLHALTLHRLPRVPGPIGESRPTTQPLTSPRSRCNSCVVSRRAARCGVQALPSKRLVTEPSSKTSWMARASSGAIGQHRHPREALLVRDRQGVGEDHLAGPAAGQPLAGRAGQHPVGGRDDHVTGRPGSSRACTALATVPPVSIMSSMTTQSRPSMSPTTRLATASLGRFGSRVLWMKASGVPPEGLGPALGQPDPTGVGGDHGQLVLGVGALDVLGQHRQREQVVHRPVEEALDLRRCAGPRS